jgi:hypothetical protein
MKGTAGGEHAGDRRRALLVMALCFAVYAANGRVIPSGDSRPARYLPFAVLRDGALTLNGFAAEVQAGVPGNYAVSVVDGRLVSSYPVVGPLLALPLYVPVAVYLEAEGWNPTALGFAAAVMEKVAASALTSLAMGLLYLLLRRRATVRDALVLTLACAFGTSTWVISSQTLWQHGPAQLLLVIALLSVSGEGSVTALSIGGLSSGLLVATRPPDLLLAAPIVVFSLVRHSRLSQRGAVVVTALLAGGLQLSYNLALFGVPLGGYQKFFSPGESSFSRPLLTGLATELLSPGKGLLVFSPFLLAVLVRPWRTGRPDHQLLDALLALGVVVQLLLYAKATMRGGDCYGPRYLTDLLPAVMWLLAPALPSLSWRGRLAFLAAVAIGVAIQAIGAFHYPAGGSDRVLRANEAARWRPANAQFILELRRAPDR